MENSEIIQILSERLGQPEKDTKRMLKSFVKTIRQFLINKIDLSIPELGTFGTKVREKRKSFIPYHEKFMMLPPKRVVYFTPSSVLKEEARDMEIEA